ncbi:uncharacterized protein [Diadema setosum]|uniref:uncharacterized protein n=1 Tax=Diadema setosum TaxID=31175 RepID=UPI003B3AEB52
MEDILTSAEAIDAMAEEIVKPSRRYDSAKTGSSASSTTTVTGPEKALGSEVRSTEGGSDWVGESGSHVTSTVSGVATSALSREAEAKKSSVDGVNSSGPVTGKQDMRIQEGGKTQNGNVRTKAAFPGVRSGPRPLPPPKPAGLLEKIKDPSGPDSRKPKNQTPATSQPSTTGQVKNHSSASAPSASRAGIKEDVKTSINSGHEILMKVDSKGTSELPRTGKQRDENVSSETHGPRSPNKVNAKVSSPPPHAPVTASLSVHLSDSPGGHDRIQRTCSSPVVAPTEAGQEKMSTDAASPDSTDGKDTAALPVRSRVHDIQENLMHLNQEMTVRQKKLSVMDHLIKISDRRAVFEKNMTGTQANDVEHLGVKKRSDRIPAPISPKPNKQNKSGNKSPNQPVVGSKSNFSSNQEPQSAAAVPPKPRPRSTISSPRDSADTGPLRVAPVRPPPQPQPRNSIVRVGHDELTPDVPEAQLYQPAESENIYERVPEILIKQDDAAAEPATGIPTSPSSQQQEDETALSENIYEDTMVDSSAESLPQLPLGSAITDTCHSSLAPDSAAGHRDSAARRVPEEVHRSDESRPRERESIYEVCFNEYVSDQSKELAPGVTDSVSESSEILQEMPIEYSLVDEIMPFEDEREDDGSIGTHKLSRQRRQRHCAVRMRSATDKQGLGPRRTGELKRQGRSIQELTQDGVEEKMEQEMMEEEEEEEEEVEEMFKTTKQLETEAKYLCVYEDQGSEGNEYEEVPSLDSSDEEVDKRVETITIAGITDAAQPMEERVDVDGRLGEGGETDNTDSKEEAENVVVRRDSSMRSRAKTSPESVRASSKVKMKRHSEGAFENFVPLFLKKPDAPAAPSALQRHSIALLREEFEQKMAFRAKQHEEAAVDAEEAAEPYSYVVEGDDEDTSSDGSDYEVVCSTDDAEHGPQVPVREKKENKSYGVYDIEGHRQAVSRDGSLASNSSSGYLVLYDDWKEVEESGRIARRNKGSNDKNRRRVIAVDSLVSEINTTQNTTQGSVDVPDQNDFMMSDEAGVYGSCDRPTSPEAHSNGHRLLKKAAAPPPVVEISAEKPAEDTPPPIPMRIPIKLQESALSPSPGMMRKPSRFVGKEPLFQIYQADLRKRDSDVILRPRTLRRSKKPPLPARTHLKNMNNPPPLPPNHPLENRPLRKSNAPPPLPERNAVNTSKGSNRLNISDSLNTSNISTSSAPPLMRAPKLPDTEIRLSLQKELFSKLNHSDSSTTNTMDNSFMLNNNIRSGDSHKIMDSSRTCSGNSAVGIGNGAPPAINTSSDGMDEMEDPTYGSSGNDEGSSSMHSMDDLLGEIDRNRTHGSSMETQSSHQSADVGLDEMGMEDPTYQSTEMGDPTYQPTEMEDPIYQSQSEIDNQAFGDEYLDDTYSDFDDDDEFSDDDYYLPPPRDGPVREGSKAFRSYWCELPEVVKSGLLGNLTQEEKKMQEALFEIITSEASYLRSLNLVVQHFVEAPVLCPPNGLLKRPEHHSLFSNIRAVRDISERLLLELEQHQQESILLSDVCRILLNHLRDQRFEQGFVTYCANNQYQVRALDQFKNNLPVTSAIRDLESHADCCSLDLLSFLMLPFQRITRLPLLLEAVISRAPEGSDMMKYAVEAFTEVRRMAEKCNDEARRMEMIEEVTILARQLDFKPGIKKMDISQSSTIVKRGTVDSIVSQANILGGKRKAIAKHIHCIVFTDKVLLAKEKTKGDQKRYEVIDWCPRNLVQVQPIDQPTMCSKLADGVPPDCHCIFSANLLQNNQRKTAEFILNVKSLSERQRWMDAMCPPSQTEDGERIYESWDCPQVICITDYVANDRDELNLEVSDRVDVYKKVEGWCEGVLVGSHARGWFPASCVQEVVNDHVRARILKKKHKILSMCEEQIRLARAGPKFK